MALVRARHEVFGVCDVPVGTLRRWPDLWERVDDDTPTGPPAVRLYDPAEHRLDPVDDDDGVIAYLVAASPAERERVIAAERARGDRARKTVLEWEPPAE